MSEPIRMELEGYPCPCPGTPHQSEWVDLESVVTIPMGMAATYVVVKLSDEATEAELRGLLAPIMLRFGIRDWSFRDGKARIPVDDTSIARLLPWSEIGFEIVDRCMDLYLAEIARPLAARKAKLSAPGSMDNSTSPTTPRRTRSSRMSSSPETTAGTRSGVPTL
jgi:hypothetical protein